MYVLNCVCVCVSKRENEEMCPFVILTLIISGITFRIVGVVVNYVFQILKFKEEKRVQKFCFNMHLFL